MICFALQVRETAMATCWLAEVRAQQTLLLKSPSKSMSHTLACNVAMKCFYNVLGLTVLMQFSCQDLESFFAKEIPQISKSAPLHALETKMAANLHRTLSYMKSSRLMSAFKVHRMHRASRIGNKRDQKQ